MTGAGGPLVAEHTPKDAAMTTERRPGAGGLRDVFEVEVAKDDRADELVAFVVGEAKGVEHSTEAQLGPVGRAEVVGRDDTPRGKERSG